MNLNVYCVMIPTHRNATSGWFDFRWRRKFSRRHDNAILTTVAIMQGGYTMMPRSEGCWMSPPAHFQIEGMRPFLFTAETPEKANIIADLVSIHYDQQQSMIFVWGYDVQFRKKRELIDLYTNILRPRKAKMKDFEWNQRPSVAAGDVPTC